MALHEDTGGIRPALDEQSGNTAAGGSTVSRDADGWIVPPLLRMAPQKQPPAEAANQRRLVDALKRGGWRTNEHSTCYDRDGNRFIPDILVWHPDLRSVGAIEVKASIDTTRSAFDALKQCFDYTNCKVLATGHRVEWGAIYPFDPAPHGAPMGTEMWGAASFAAMQLKVCVLIDEPAFKRWEGLLNGLDEVRVYSPERIRLQYKAQHRVWCTDNGFVANAADMLTGKRKVGGTRRHA